MATPNGGTGIAFFLLTCPVFATSPNCLDERRRHSMGVLSGRGTRRCRGSGSQFHVPVRRGGVRPETSRKIRSSSRALYASERRGAGHLFLNSQFDWDVTHPHRCDISTGAFHKSKCQPMVVSPNVLPRCRE